MDLVDPVQQPHAADIDATGPNNASRPRRASIPVTESAPSAIATARSPTLVLRSRVGP
jgi:hypothetical protein